jgi:hypothetical protein
MGKAQCKYCTMMKDKFYEKKKGGWEQRGKSRFSNISNLKKLKQH